MSTISSQCDELRDWACELRKLANGPANEGFPARANLFKSADAMCQAADTILELRDDLQRANEAVQDAEHDESMAWDRVRKAEVENVKLRELVRDMMEFFEDGDWCVKCERARDCQAQEQYEDECLMRFVFRDRMRELGVNEE